jgi:hypothetical protein
VEASFKLLSIDAVLMQWSILQRIGNHIFCRQFMYHREGAMKSLESGLVRHTAGSPSRADPFSREHKWIFSVLDIIERRSPAMAKLAAKRADLG